MNSTITAVAGLEAGHHTDQANATGCTVFLCRQGAVGGVDVRGGSPGTRETDLLRPMHRVDRVHAIVLSGGSAFGLDAASGVVSYLESQGIGVKVGQAVVPIVSAAILFDLGLATPGVRPGPAEGRAACLAAGAQPMSEGSVGAGTGATVGKARGLARATKGGIGSASLELPGGLVVAAAVAVNAYGGVVDHRTNQMVAGPRRADGAGFEDTVGLFLRGEAGVQSPALTNTTIGVVATNASISREEANFLAQASHNGLALTIRPCHTIRDGDTMFALATGQTPGPADITSLTVAAVEVTALAVLRAIRTAASLGGVPAASDLDYV
ncbi:MAG: P1 family peptidase [SAR202 cluster bacterium]|nr:P1 family peptidase [SAR202 cluster bacterium]